MKHIGVISPEEKNEMADAEYELFSQKMIKDLIQSKDFKDKSDPRKKEILKDHKKYLKQDIIYTDLRLGALHNCPKCGCNKYDEDGCVIQCRLCSRGIHTFTDNWAILKWNNGIF